MPPKAKMAAKRRAPAPKPKKRKAQKTPVKAKKIKIDPKTMLLKVIRLGEEMRKGGNKGKRLTLKELNIPNVCKEVDEMPPGMLQGHIEKVILETVNNILEGKGFSFTMPTRSSSNQLYVPELDRIVLKDKMITREFATVSNSKKVAITTKVLQLVYELCVRQIHTTKRDLFYTDVKLFEKQDNTDDVLDDVACMVGCTRSSLRVVASEKGIVVGRIIFDEAGDEIDCTKMGIGGKGIPPHTDRITNIRSDAKFILLVEKDAAFQRLAEDRFYNTYPCIIITAKGQPDVATRHFLKKIKTELNIPVLGLVDADPYGLKILSVYMSGSKNMSYDSAHLTTPDIKWLGIRPTDLDKYGIPEQCRLSMTEHDIKTGKQLLKEDFIKKNPEWFKELEHMVRTKEKAEIQALSSFGFQYLTQVYLPQKIAQGDWI